MSENPEIQGELALQTLAMPKDTNVNGDIFVSFLSPVKVGATVSR
jgi:acyl-CoA hydrolase